MPPRVLLIHGLLNAKSWLWPLATNLRRQGFDTELFGYSSLLDGPGRALPRLRERLSEDRFGAIVGHSLGGLIALEALRHAPTSTVTRVVCIGSPLRGSLTARNIAARPWIRPLLGRSAELLQGGLEAWAGQAEVGLVAGNVARGMGRLFARFEGDSDGTVGLEETRLPGLADHCVVRSSHTGLVFSREAAMQTAHFLHHGRFQRTAEAPAV